MALPLFERDGFLPPGIWTCPGEEFIERFCQGKHRRHFAKVIQDVCDFAKDRGALRMLVGGSFVTREEQPTDLDCVVVFAEENQIPERSERIAIDSTKLDIFFCAETYPDVLNGFVALLSYNRLERNVGVIEINLWGTADYPAWKVVEEPDRRVLDIIKRVYFHRHIIDRNNSKKALITVHGILSHAEWNAEIAHIASSSGWIFAPFTYGYVEADVFLDAKQRRKIVDLFRIHINDIYDRYHCNISVIAHSLGTYVVAKYLLGFDVPPVSIDTFLLTGSILNEDIKIEDFYGRAAKIINEIAPNDPWVKWARRANLWQDKLLGRSGDVGFKKTSTRLHEHTSEILTHNNVILRDVVTKRWMPWLESSVGAVNKEATELRAKSLLEKLRS